MFSTPRQPLQNAPDYFSFHTRSCCVQFDPESLFRTSEAVHQFPVGPHYHLHAFPNSHTPPATSARHQMQPRPCTHCTLKIFRVVLLRFRRCRVLSIAAATVKVILIFFRLVEDRIPLNLSPPSSVHLLSKKSETQSLTLLKILNHDAHEGSQQHSSQLSVLSVGTPYREKIVY